MQSRWVAAQAVGVIVDRSFERALLHAYCAWAMTGLAPAPSCDQRLSTYVQYEIQSGNRLTAFEDIVVGAQPCKLGT